VLLFIAGCLGVGSASPVAEVRVDILEVHHHMAGDHEIYSQMIFWMHCWEGPTDYRSAGFVLLPKHDCDGWPIRVGGRWRVLVSRSDHVFRVVSGVFRERWLQYDPERESVHLWHDYPPIQLFSKPTQKELDEVRNADCER
jgi:hypothetical protein